jgi:hypothetical protein
MTTDPRASELPHAGSSHDLACTVAGLLFTAQLSLDSIRSDNTLTSHDKQNLREADVALTSALGYVRTLGALDGGN